MTPISAVAQSCPTLGNPMNYSMPGFPVQHQFLKLTQTHILWVSDAIQPSHPLSSSSPSTLNLSQHQGLFSESPLHIRWPKFWSFSFNISPSNEYSGLILLRMDWLDLLAVQGTLKSLLQHHSSKALILQNSTSGTLSIRSKPLNLFSLPLYNCKGFSLVLEVPWEWARDVIGSKDGHQYSWGERSNDGAQNNRLSGAERYCSTLKCKDTIL